MDYCWMSSDNRTEHDVLVICCLFVVYFTVVKILLHAWYSVKYINIWGLDLWITRGRTFEFSINWHGGQTCWSWSCFPCCSHLPWLQTVPFWMGSSKVNGAFANWREFPIMVWILTKLVPYLEPLGSVLTPTSLNWSSKMTNWSIKSPGFQGTSSLPSSLRPVAS